MSHEPKGDQPILGRVEKGSENIWIWRDKHILETKINFWKVNAIVEANIVNPQQFLTLL